MDWRPLSALLLVLAWSLAVAGDDESSSPWPAWHDYQQALIAPSGRVIDASDPRRITTSEGQSYALFFALVANDQESFTRILAWTQRHLARGDLGAVLPAWLWGRQADGEWGVLDDNSASDADLWLAYTLLEAARLWQRRDYRVIGTQLAQRIAREEVQFVPGLGPLLLPARRGFDDDGLWRFNPSYLPPQVVARLAKLGEPWQTLHAKLPDWLMAVAPQGLAPDWAAWHSDQGWIPDPVHGSQGDYDAIRVYLWLGMLAPQARGREALLAHFQPMQAFVTRKGRPPERVDAASGVQEGTGNSGFSAALLPFLTGDAAKAQRHYLSQHPPAPDAYYSQSLRLFGEGFASGRYRFAADGRLIPAWNASAAGSEP